MWKSVHAGLHNSQTLSGLLVLRYRFQEVPSSRKSSKLLKGAVILTVKKLSCAILQKNFCEM